jgi:OOP family OmpA-OmpF porin
MKNFILLLSFFLTFTTFSQTDKENCTEHPLIPTRIPDYFIGNCDANDFSSHTVLTPQGEKVIEGKKTVLEYFLKEGGKGVSETYVRKNYMDAIRKLGAKIEHEQFGRGVGIIKQADGTTYWVDVTGYVGDGTPEQTGHYYLVIVEIAAMEQVITAKGLGDDLKQTGRAVLYIQFDTGKSTIKPESAKVIEQMAAYLNANQSTTIYIVGHTDNEGSLEMNLKLAEDRANAVVTVLITRHKVAENQLIAKGVGPLSPIASNLTDAGKKLNRRVEMVLR